MDYKGKSPEHWRTYFFNGVYDKRPEVSRKTSDSIVENLVRYSLEGKTLSNEGYKTIVNLWEKVEENTELNKKYVTLAREFLINEKKRLDEKRVKLEALALNESRTHLRYEIEPKRKGFFRRLREAWVA